MAVLKSRLQMYGGAMFVLDIKTRYKAPNEHIFNKGAIKRAELLDAWHRFMDTPGDQGGFDPARMLSDEDLVVRKAAPGSRAGTRAGPLTRDAARGDARLGHFRARVHRLRQSLAGRTPKSPRLSRRARRSSAVCASGASGRLCGSTSAPTVRTTSGPRTAKKCDDVDEDVDEDEEDPFTVL